VLAAVSQALVALDNVVSIKMILVMWRPVRAWERGARDHAARAVRAALEIVHEVNERYQGGDDGLPRDSDGARATGGGTRSGGGARSGRGERGRAGAAPVSD
jgi:uncharacterized membrane protein YgcG